MLTAATASAQETRGTILGTVTDASGATVPQARITVANVATGVAAPSTTNAEGAYVVPFLIPGSYTVKVEREGFKAVERGPLELRVADRLRVDITLEVGQLSDRVVVTAVAPLLETSSSNRGQVITGKQITDLPLASKNINRLVDLAAGVQFTGGMQFARPFDGGGSSNFVINGGRSAWNEWQLDGLPNNFTGGSGVSAVPPIEATQEFKVQTNTYDAQYGRTSGGVISLSVKPGTNHLHGAAYEYLRRTGLNANSFANNASNTPRAFYLSDQYGFEIDGPVVLPKYKGRDRTFFMFALEKYRDQLPRPTLGSVPTAEQRRGDFSQTRNPNGTLRTIYDPLQIRPNPAFDPGKPVTLNNLQYLRSAFPGNQVPQSRMNPIAQKVLADIPAPNQTGDPVTFLQNWLGGGVTENNKNISFIGRLDHTFGAWKLFGRFNKEHRDGGQIDYYGWNTPATSRSHGSERDDGAVADVVGTLTPTTIFNARFGVTWARQGSRDYPYDMAKLGFPSDLLRQLQNPNRYPIIEMQDYMTISRNDNTINSNVNYTGQANVVKIVNSHSMKFGFEYRILQAASIPRNNTTGTYSFSRSWTSSTPQLSDANSGNAVASFLLGYMSDASATLNVTPYWSWKYPVLFFQDDWQVTRRLTLNLGLRWDYESPTVERFDRQNRGFDFTAKSPYQVPGLDLRGGLLFAGVNGQPRTTFNSDRNNWQPRAGVAYKPFTSKSLVLRGGVGRYFFPQADFGTTHGFSQVTNAVTSTPDYLPFNTLSNPFPNGLIQPPGSSRGLATQVGDSLTFADPTRTVPYVWQFSAGFQYELWAGVLVDASYVGSRSKQLQVNRSLTYLTAEQLALGTPYLNQSVPNPFYGVLPITTPRGAQPNIQRRNLMGQYPQYTGLTSNFSNLGSSWYNAFQLRVEKRFSQGLTALVSYTNSKTMESVAYLNAQDKNLARELTSWDVPQRLVISTLYEFPIGPGKKWAGSGVLSHIVGGWQLGLNVLKQSGTPMSYPDWYLYGNPKLESGRTLSRWFDTSRQIWVQRPTDTLRTTPLRSPNIRRHTAPQLDTVLIRNFRIREGHTMQFKASAYNALNTPIFNFPNTSPTSALFGVVPATQLNLPRNVEIGFRYAF
ncbi:MAG: TonB-dependent receptor domain-containing protein [Bryobacteraceae bacterium]